MNGRFVQRDHFPSGNFDRLPSINSPRSRRPAPSRIAWFALGATFSLVLEALVR